MQVQDYLPKQKPVRKQAEDCYDMTSQGQCASSLMKKFGHLIVNKLPAHDASCAGTCATHPKHRAVEVNPDPVLFPQVVPQLLDLAVHLKHGGNVLLSFSGLCCMQLLHLVTSMHTCRHTSCNAPLLVQCLPLQCACITYACPLLCAASSPSTAFIVERVPSWPPI